MVTHRKRRAVLATATILAGLSGATSGWAQGEKQAVEIFLSDLGRLERDIVGMARYRVLLRAGLVEQPKVAFQNRSVDGGRDSLHVGDRTIRITDQPGLQGNARRWAPGAGCPR
jgi:defect-in-organelle-trafficking protein DotC